MGKPFNDQGGSGFHLHVSLDRDDDNAFADRADADGVSGELRHFTAGVLAHAPALMAFLNPTINAYRRIVPDSLAPTHANWGWDNRTTFVRIPAERGARDARRDPRRRRQREPVPRDRRDPASPACTACARSSRCPTPVAGDAYTPSDGRARRCPTSLDAALDALEADDAPARRDRRRRSSTPFLAIKRFELERHRSVGLRLGARRVPPPPLGARPMTDARHDRPLRPRRLRRGACPHEWFAHAARARTPCTSTPRPDGPGFYAVTRYARHPRGAPQRRLYSSEIGGTSLEDLDPEQIEARKSMIDMDPPRHDELRGLIARRFTPARRPACGRRQVRTVTDARARPRAADRASSTSSREISSEIPMQVFAEILGVPQDERRVHHRARRPPARQPGPRVRAADRRRAPPAAVLQPGGARDVRVRAQDGRGAAQAPGQRHHHPARVRAADPARVRRLLRAARHGRQRDDAPHDHARAARRCSSTRTSSSGCASDPSLVQAARPRRCCAGRRPSTTSAAPTTRRHGARGRRDPAPARRSRPGSSPATATRRSFEDPDTFDVGRTPNKHMAFGPGRHPPLHGRAPRADGGPDRVRGAAQARRRRSSWPARPSGCGRTSSTASSGCRCG